MSPSHRVQTGSGAHPASYPMGTGSSFPGGKTAGGVKLTTHINLVQRLEMRGAIPPLPKYVIMAWCLVKYRDTFTFTLSFGVATRLVAGRSGVLGFNSRWGLGNLNTASRTALGPTQPPIQCVPETLSRGVKLTTYLHLTPRSRIRGAIPPLPNMS
jgi:hypothetical protein